jgi:branched-chain amino acid transport system substrate-binding protein
MVHLFCPKNIIIGGRKMKIFRIVILGLVICLIFIGTSYSQVPGVAKDTIKIGMITTMSGPAGWMGKMIKTGAELYFDELNQAGGVNGRKIVMITGDDECTASKAISSTKRLIERNQVFTLLGGGCSVAVVGMIPLIDETGIPFYSSISASERLVVPLHKTVFHAGNVRFDHASEFMVDMAVKFFKAKKIGYIGITGEYGAVLKFLEKGLNKYQMKMVSVETYNLPDTDMSSQILKLKAADPEVTILQSYVKDAAIILRQAKDLGFKTLWMGGTAVATGDFMKVTGNDSVGVVMLWSLGEELPENPRSPQMVNFITKYKNKYGYQPDFVEALSYAGAIVLTEGIKRAGKDLTREKLIGALETLREFPTGITAPITFTKDNHFGISYYKMVQVKPGSRREFLEPKWAPGKGLVIK